MDLQNDNLPKFKGWELYDILPAGWKIDLSCGSPLSGYDFCTDGKSIINGGKRALVKSIRRGSEEVKFIERKEKIFEKQGQKESKQEQCVFPSQTVNILARKKFQEQLLKEIKFDLIVCEIEGWGKKEYIRELKELINSIDLQDVKVQLKNNTYMTKLLGYLSGRYPVYAQVPEGWVEIKEATTAPIGYTWYCNNKSLLGGERESGLVQTSLCAKEILDVNGETIRVGDMVRTKQHSGGILPPAPSQVGTVVMVDYAGSDQLAIEFKDAQGRSAQILLHGQINEKIL